MKNSQFLFSLLIIIFTLSACEKVNLHERKIDGDYWQITQFLVNGIDSTSFVTYPSVLGYRFEETETETHKFHRFHNIYEVEADGTEKHFGHWGRREENRMFLGVEYKLDETGPFYHQHYYKDFEIIKLKKKEMEFKLSFNGDIYELRFER